MMEEKIDNGTVQLVESDDVLLFGEETFTVAKFVKLLTQDFRQKNNPLYHLGAGQVQMKLDESKWHSQSLDCQLLKVGSKGWQKGKIKSKFSFFPEESSDEKIVVYFEFSPDEPLQPESPLDDLRELPEYKQQM
jgi:hypothetical protein